MPPKVSPLPSPTPTPHQLPLPALTPRTIMHNLMRKNITLNAKHPPTRLALIPPTLTHIALPLPLPPPLTPASSERRPPRFLLAALRRRCRERFGHRLRRRRGKGSQAPEAGSLVPLGAGACPGDFFPVAQGEEMVIAAREMRA